MTRATVEVRGDGAGSLRAFLASHLRAHQLERPEVRRLVSGGAAADALDATGLRLAVALLAELRAGDASVPSARHLLRGRARVEPVTEPEEEEEAGDNGEAARKRAAYLAARRRKLLRLDEEMRYGGMVRNVKALSAPRELERHQTSARQHLSIGANMVAARITAFAAVYMVARTLTDDETTRMVAGLGGAVAMMVVEMLLFIARASKLEAVEQQQRKSRERAFE